MRASHFAITESGRLCVSPTRKCSGRRRWKRELHRLRIVTLLVNLSLFLYLDGRRHRVHLHRSFPPSQLKGAFFSNRRFRSQLPARPEPGLDDSPSARAGRPRTSHPRRKISDPHTGRTAGPVSAILPLDFRGRQPCCFSMTSYVYKNGASFGRSQELVR